MTLRPIRSKREHQAALREIEALWEAPSGSPEADRLEVLTLLVEAYEREHYPIEAPDPIDFKRAPTPSSSSLQNTSIGYFVIFASILSIILISGLVMINYTKYSIKYLVGSAVSRSDELEAAPA